MAKSPAHRFGQIIGAVLETAVEAIVTAQAKKHDLFVDKKGARTCRKGKLLSWEDGYGNKHNLDYVLERGGSQDTVGRPAAFIEVAWRRYTKHSRAKAQEVQGAILPLRDHYQHSAPFYGIVIAGVFTKPAIQQLKSLGFAVLLVSTESIEKAFSRVGIDAKADETTTDKQFQKQVDAYLKLSHKQKKDLADFLLADHAEDVETFSVAMDKVLSRQVKRVVILPLHGSAHEFGSVEEALESIESLKRVSTIDEFIRYEIEVRYDNEDIIRGVFKTGESAVEFLNRYKAVAVSIPDSSTVLGST